MVMGDGGVHQKLQGKPGRIICRSVRTGGYVVKMHTQRRGALFPAANRNRLGGSLYQMSSCCKGQKELLLQMLSFLVKD